MIGNIETTCAELVERSRMTSALPIGNRLRSDRMMLEHHQLRQALNDLLEYHAGYASTHTHLVRLVKRLLAACSLGTNGHRYWTPNLPQPVKTAAILLNTFLRGGA